MFKRGETDTNNVKALLVISILGIVVGLLLLILSKYMLTSFAFSIAQTKRANIVNDCGRVVLIPSLLLATAIFARLASKDILRSKR